MPLGQWNYTNVNFFYTDVILMLIMLGMEGVNIGEAVWSIQEFCTISAMHLHN